MLVERSLDDSSAPTMEQAVADEFGAALVAAEGAAAVEEGHGEEGHVAAHVDRSAIEGLDLQSHSVDLAGSEEQELADLCMG